MAGLRLFYKSKLCDATDCTTNQILKVSKIEETFKAEKEILEDF